MAMAFLSSSSILLHVELFLCLFIQLVNSQASMSVDTKIPYECNKDLELRCQYSGSKSCCQISRLWRRNGSTIMNDGVEILPIGKYFEEVVNSEKYFTLKIKDLTASDFSVPYICDYAGEKSSAISLDIDNMCCGFSAEGFGKCFGFALIGVLVVVVVGFIICIITGFEMKKSLRTLAVISVTSIIVNLLVGGLIGGFTLLCCGGNTKCPACIAIGFAISLVDFVIVYFIFKAGGSEKEENMSEKKQPVT